MAAAIGPVTMTAPRRIIAGTTYLVTRRCLDRQFLLRPSKLTNQNFGFLLAVAAQRFDIDLHACCVMSNQMGLANYNIQATQAGQLVRPDREALPTVAVALRCLLVLPELRRPSPAGQPPHRQAPRPVVWSTPRPSALETARHDQPRRVAHRLLERRCDQHALPRAAVRGRRWPGLRGPLRLGGSPLAPPGLAHEAAGQRGAAPHGRPADAELSPINAPCRSAA